MCWKIRAGSGGCFMGVSELKATTRGPQWYSNTIMQILIYFRTSWYFNTKSIVWVLQFVHLAASFTNYGCGNAHFTYQMSSDFAENQTRFKKDQYLIWRECGSQNVSAISYLIFNIFSEFFCGKTDIFQAKMFSKSPAPTFPPYWSFLALRWFSSKSKNIWYAKWPLPLW